MTDEERAAANKAAIEAMRNAKANMGVAIERIEQLERALRAAATNLGGLKQYIPSGAYVYPNGTNNPRKAQDLVDAAVAEINKVL